MYYPIYPLVRLKQRRQKKIIFGCYIVFILFLLLFLLAYPSEYDYISKRSQNLSAVAQVCKNLYYKFEKTLFKISSRECFTGHKNITWKYERMIYSSFQICALSRTSNKYRFFFRNSKKKHFSLINYYCTIKYLHLLGELMLKRKL